MKYFVLSYLPSTCPGGDEMLLSRESVSADKSVVSAPANALSTVSVASREVVPITRAVDGRVADAWEVDGRDNALLGSTKQNFSVT